MPAVASPSPPGEIHVVPPSGGADAGPELRAALQSAADGRIVIVDAGEFTFSTPVVVPSRSRLQLRSPTIHTKGDQPFLKSNPGTEGITIEGSVAVDAGESTSNAMAFFGTKGVRLQLDAVVSFARPGRGLILCDACSDVTVGGSYRSVDSRIFLASDSSNVEVSGVKAGPYRTDPADGIVRVTAKGHAGPISGIHLHDITVDGGGVLGTAGGVDVAPDPGQPDITNVNVHDIVVSNTLRLVDGVDVNRCSNVAVARVSGESVNTVLAVIASNAHVESVEGRNCRGQAFAYGDPSYQTTDIQGCSVTTIRATDCGRAYGGVGGAGVGVFRSPGTQTSDVELRDVVSVDSGARAQKFGLGIGEGVLRVKLVGGRLGGYLGAVKDLSAPGNLVLEGVDGAT
jgi:hypothetical protein